jgi:outer membrane protein TolC
VRYRNGAIALKNLLDAQETTRNARLSLVETKQNQYNAYVTLMQALGGSPVKNYRNNSLRVIVYSLILLLDLDYSGSVVYV